MCVIAPSANAAVNTSNGCKASTTGAAEMAHYPAWPGSQSYLKVGCIFSHNTGNDFVSSNFTVHDFSNVLYHQGAARVVTNASTVNNTSPLITVNGTAPECATMSAFVNRPIQKISTGGANIKAYTTVKSVAGCVLTLNQNPGGGSSLPNTATYKIENSDVRSVNDASLQAGSPNITSALANFRASDLNCSVSGTNWQDGAIISPAPAPGNVADTSPAPISYALNPLPAASQVVTICGSKVTATARETVDPAAVATATTIKSGKVKWTADDIGMRVWTEPNIASATPPGIPITGTCYIQSFTVPPGNTATLVGTGCNATGATTFTVGEPSFTAPISTDTVLNLANELPLEPSLVKGSHDCSEDQAAGFGIEGTWNNPGSFAQPDGLFLNPQPSGTKAIGQILFTTSVVSFAAYVVELPTASDPLIGAPHYNIEFPGAPTGVALCASTPTSPGLGLSIGVNGTTVSQGALGTGLGRPGTSQFRSTMPSTTGSTNTIYITDDIGGGGVKWLGSEFNRLCPIPAGKPDISPPNGFICGDA